MAMVKLINLTPRFPLDHPQHLLVVIPIVGSRFLVKALVMRRMVYQPEDRT